jgi:Fe-S cluster assembly protein SufD
MSFVSLFESLAPGRKTEPAWLRERRAAAIARFAERGFPTTRDEEWKYTSVAPIAGTEFRHTAARVADLPKTPGVEISTLREAGEALAPYLDPAAGTVFQALNTALCDDVTLVRIAPGTILREPLRLTYRQRENGAPHAMHPRTVVLAGERSQAAIVESYEGSGTYLTNAATTIALDSGAVVDHYKVQRESEAAFHVGALDVRQARASRFQSHSICLGGKLVRNDIDTLFDGEGGECVLNGLFMAGDSQHMDTHTRIDHKRAHCTSRELYKGVLDGRARGVFHGLILVRKDAQKTDAHQTNRNLLLSKEALVNSTPQLEILADDVKCKHGSTTGQLDPVALFYLRSRGISEAAARSLLTYAFASDIVSRIEVADVREALGALLQRRLGQEAA